jgi:hypothetical protein
MVQENIPKISKKMCEVDVDKSALEYTLYRNIKRF